MAGGPSVHVTDRTCVCCSSRRKKIVTAADGSCACMAATSVERIFKWIKKKEIKPATYGLHYYYNTKSD